MSNYDIIKLMIMSHYVFVCYYLYYKLCKEYNYYNYLQINIFNTFIFNRIN